MSGYRGSVNSGHSGLVSTEDQRNSGNRGIVFIEGYNEWVQRTSGTVGTQDQRNSENRGPVGTEDQWVQRTKGPVGTEDQRNSGNRGPDDQWAQRI